MSDERCTNCEGASKLIKTLIRWWSSKVQPNSIHTPNVFVAGFLLFDGVSRYESIFRLYPVANNNVLSGVFNSHSRGDSNVYNLLD